MTASPVPQQPSSASNVIKFDPAAANKRANEAVNPFPVWDVDPSAWEHAIRVLVHTWCKRKGVLSETTITQIMERGFRYLQESGDMGDTRKAVRQFVKLIRDRKAGRLILGSQDNNALKATWYMNSNSYYHWLGVMRDAAKKHNIPADKDHLIAFQKFCYDGSVGWQFAMAGNSQEDAERLLVEKAGAYAASRQPGSVNKAVNSNKPTVGSLKSGAIKSANCYPVDKANHTVYLEDFALRSDCKEAYPGCEPYMGRAVVSSLKDYQVLDALKRPTQNSLFDGPNSGQEGQQVSPMTAPPITPPVTHVPPKMDGIPGSIPNPTPKPATPPTPKPAPVPPSQPAVSADQYAIMHTESPITCYPSPSGCIVVGGYRFNVSFRSGGTPEMARAACQAWLDGMVAGMYLLTDECKYHPPVAAPEAPKAPATPPATPKPTSEPPAETPEVGERLTETTVEIAKFMRGDGKGVEWSYNFKLRNDKTSGKPKKLTNAKDCEGLMKALVEAGFNPDGWELGKFYHMEIVLNWTKGNPIPNSAHGAHYRDNMTFEVKTRKPA